jgi:putative transposase
VTCTAIGRQIACHMRTTLVLDALRMALGTRRPGADVQLVQHTDQGSHVCLSVARSGLNVRGVICNAEIAQLGVIYNTEIA